MADNTLKQGLEVSTKSNLSGLNAATSAVQKNGNVIVSMAKSAAGAASGGVKALVNGVKTLSKMGLDGLKKGFEGVKSAAGGALKALAAAPQQIFFLKDLLGSIKDAFVGFITAAAEQSPLLKGKLDQLAAPFNKLKGQVIDTVVKAMLPAFDALLKVFDDPRFQEFLAYLVTYLGKAVAWLTDLFVKKLIPAFLALLPKIKPIVSAIETFFRAVKSGQDPLLALTNAIVAIAKVFGVSQKDLSKFSTAMYGVRKVVEEVKKFIAEEALPRIQHAIAAVAEWWQKHSQEIMAAARALWSSLGPILQALWDELAKLWKDIGPKLIAAVKDIYDEVIPTVFAIANWIKENSDTIIAVIRNLSSVVGSIIRILIDAVTAIVRAGLAIIRGDWEGAWNAIQQFLSSTATNLRNMVYNLFDAILRIFGSSAASAAAAWSGIWDNLVVIVQAVWVSIQTAVSDGITAVVGFLSTLSDAVRSPWNGLTDFVGGIWGGIRSTVARGVNWVIGVLNSMIDAYNTVISVLGGTPLPHIPYIDEGASVAGASVAGASGVAGARGAQSAAASPATSGQPFIIQIYGPFGPGYTPEDAGTRAGNAFVFAARAQGLRI
jgi:hypothetical protein